MLAIRKGYNLGRRSTINLNFIIYFFGGKNSYQFDSLQNALNGAAQLLHGVLRHYASPSGQVTLAVMLVESAIQTVYYQLYRSP